MTSVRGCTNRRACFIRLIPLRIIPTCYVLLMHLMPCCRAWAAHRKLVQKTSNERAFEWQSCALNRGQVSVPHLSLLATHGRACTHSRASSLATIPPAFELVMATLQQNKAKSDGNAALRPPSPPRRPRSTGALQQDLSDRSIGQPRPGHQRSRSTSSVVRSAPPATQQVQRKKEENFGTLPALLVLGIACLGKLVDAWLKRNRKPPQPSQPQQRGRSQSRQ